MVLQKMPTYNTFTKAYINDAKILPQIISNYNCLYKTLHNTTNIYINKKANTKLIHKATTYTYYTK